MPAPRWDLIKGRVYGKGVTIATRGCPFACEYCTIPQMYQRPDALSTRGLKSWMKSS
jgi:radical SAM superfamily enzyme YgiQ (UPF0313 family)